MKNVNIKQQFKNVISFFAIVGLLSMTSIVVLPIGKTHAITSLPVVPSSINTTTSLGIAASPFYESNVSKLIGQRVVSTANGIPPQIEYTNIENGTIKGVGNVTNLQTWTDTSRSPRIIYGVGQGVITTADGQDMATWIGYGIGRSNINGTTTYHDIILFNTNSTGRLAFLKNIEGLHIAEADGNKRTTKIYEWKS
ncbi:MAG: hypothetical protein WBE61_01010 [Nitrososphaeraceae archaeon]